MNMIVTTYQGKLDTTLCKNMITTYLTKEATNEELEELSYESDGEPEHDKIKQSLKLAKTWKRESKTLVQPDLLTVISQLIPNLNIDASKPRYARVFRQSETYVSCVVHEINDTQVLLEFEAD